MSIFSLKKVALVIVLVVCASASYARLGESAADLEKRFGAPVNQLKQPGQNELIQYQYFNHDLMIYVTLFRGASVVEHYLKLKSVPVKGEEPVVVALPKELAVAILQASAEGSKWQDMGESDEDVKFARDDKKALAVILKKNKVMIELRICDINFVETLSKPRN